MEKEIKKVESIGIYDGNEIIKKTGKFGDYLQCGEVNIPFKVNETIQSVIERIENKKDKSAPLNKFKEYEIRNGQYGPYIIKTSLKKAKFVSVPKGVNISELKEKDVEALYKAGLDKKKRFIPK
jgi:topoisomerase IA-like protein